MTKLLNKLLIITLFMYLLNCSSNDAKKVEKNVDILDNKVEKRVEKKVEKKTEKKRVIVSVKTGWSDKDTYVVQVTAADENSAVNFAKTKILKDIIKVRLKKYGTYSKIQEIKEEFEDPLKNGKVINRSNVKNGIKIYYLIRDKNLRQKFELSK